MSEEYKDNKIEAKSADSSSGGYAPPAEHIPAKEAPEQELYHAKSFGPNGFSVRMRRLLEFNTL